MSFILPPHLAATHLGANPGARRTPLLHRMTTRSPARSGQAEAPLARAPWARAGIVLGVASALAAGCDLRLPESRVYPTQPDVPAKLALAYQRSENGGVTAFEDLVAGSGRVAQSTRQMVLHLRASTEDGAVLAAGDAQVLVPPLRPLAFPGGALHGDYDPGNLPAWLAGSIMGMQVGGTRRIRFDPARAAAPPSRRALAPAAGPPDEPIVDGRTGQVVLRLPRAEAFDLDVTLLGVCTPHFTVWQFPTLLDRGTERVLHVGACT